MSEATNSSSSSNKNRPTPQQPALSSSTVVDQQPAATTATRSTLNVTSGNQLNASTSSSLLSSSSSSSSSSSNISNHSPASAAAVATAATNTTSALHNLILVEETPQSSSASATNTVVYCKSSSTGSRDATTTSSTGSGLLLNASGTKMLSTSLNIPLSAASSHQNLISSTTTTSQSSTTSGNSSAVSTTLIPSISINTKHITNSSISLLTVSNKASSGVGSASIVNNSSNGGGGSTPNTTTTSPTSAYPPSISLNSNILSANVYNTNSNNSSQNNLTSSFSSNQSQPGFNMSSSGAGSVPSSESSPVSSGHGHFFAKKTFHKPTYCHHCTEMLWGLIGQGFVCEVCNFVCHEKCQKYVISVCSTKAHSLVKNPVAHCWSEPGLFKRKFCNVCRKRLEDNQSVRCEICDYHAHVDCQSLAVADCCETATYTPSMLQWLSSEGSISSTSGSGVILHRHHWREGNLPSNSKCMVCKKTCWTSECLAGLRCEWCGLTTHSMCRQRVGEECNFGKLRDIIVPPYAISVPRVDINKAAILGIQSSSASSWSPGNGASGASTGGGRQSGKVRSNSGEWSSGGDFKSENNSEFTVTPPPSISTNVNLNSSYNNNTNSSLLASSVGSNNNNSSSNLTALSQSQHSPLGGYSSNNNSSSPSGSGSLPPSPFFSKESNLQPTGNTLLPTTTTNQTVSSSSSTSSKKKDKSKSGEDEEESREVIRVYDGNVSFRKRMFKTITVPKNSAYRTIIEASLRTFHINDDPSKYFISIPFLVNTSSSSSSSSQQQNQQQQQTATTSVLPHMDYSDYQLEERLVEETNPIKFIKTFLLNNRLENTKPSVMLRYKDELVDTVRIYLDASLDLHAYQLVKINLRTSVNECIQMAMERFDLTGGGSASPDHYFMMEVLVDQEVRKRVMSGDELPLQIIKLSRRESLCSNRIVRFYLHRRDDQSELSVPLFVGNLPTGLSQIQYEKILMESLLKNNNDCRWDRIDVYYYEYGSLVMLYEDAERAARAYKMLKDAYYENKQLTVLLLPTIQTPLIPPNVCPLLVFVNVKSGGQQGADLITSFRHLLNPHQVFDLQNCGPLPGLYVFRNIESYRILACGGDGTIGWVLSCLDNVSQDARCQSPPMAIVPIGTGNDLARVLRWGTGYTGGEDPIGLLSDVIDAEEITLDRWTVVFHSDENKEQEDLKKQQSIAVNPNQPNTNEDNTHIFVMNNYFGIGIDADVALDFHTAREGNPNKFNSRLNNKKYYLQMGIRKIMSKSREKIDFNRYVTVEVDGRRIDLPPIEGIIILNILSWGGGFNPWGSEKDDVFSKPNHYDGMLEVIGIRGILHIGQILSGMSNAIRLAQGGRIKIRMNTDIPIQVDGEPWLQSPCTITIIKSALKATMLKKSKIKIKRRNTEPNVNVPNAVASSSVADNSTGSSGPATTANNKETTDPVVVVDQDGDSEPFQ